MPEKGIITTNQFVWLLFTVITSFTVLQAPGMLLVIASRDAWLSAFGGWLLDILLALVYAYLGIRFPGENFVQYSSSIFGKYPGKIVGILFPLFFLLVSVLLQQSLSQLLHFVFLPKTPYEVILISAFLIIGYGARKGVEVLGRASELLGPLYLLSIIIVCLFVLPAAKVELLKPQLEQGFYPVFSGSFFILTFFGICIMMAMFIPLCNRPENGFLAKFIAVSLGAISVSLILLFSIAVFGIEQVRNMYSPSLELSRVIQIGRFLERVELIWMLIAVGAGIIASAQMVWAFSLGFSQIFGLKTYKPLVYPGVLVAVVLSVTSFDSNMEQANFLHYTFIASRHSPSQMAQGFACTIDIEILLLFDRGISFY